MEIKDELLDIEGIKNSKRPLIELFIRRTAVITSTQESLSEKIIRDQWQKALKATSDSTDIKEVDFCNLGTFFISPGKAGRRINKLQFHNKAMLEGRSNTVKSKISKEEKIKYNQSIIDLIKRKTKQTNETQC